MLSVYLCGLAVLICFVIGSTLGILMSESERFSAFMRPINDTLQTMPQFVLLIPAVMIFKLGDFTALIAIVLYAIVPTIRYTEHGLRNLPKEVLEAANSMGTTKLQLLFQVKLPLAMPSIMLGLNQTVLYAVAMLVISALVGTSDLGQLVYIGLGNGDFGFGIVAGLGMAILAIITDRMIQAAAQRRREETGMAE
jgi:glycine betaine/proline transport system permease protein